MRTAKVFSYLVSTLLIGFVIPVSATYGGERNDTKRAGRVRFQEEIVEMIEQIDESTALAYIEDLVAFGPRVTGTPACEMAGDYIYNSFADMGLEVRYHHWSNGGYSGNNIEATLPGENPSSDEIYIICGHYDSVSGCPGADDNASGTAATLACAEIMSHYAFNHTIRFVAFSGEEQWMLGSEIYVQEAFQNGDNIVAALNVDMIGYAENDYDRTRIKVYHDDASYWIVDFTDNVAQEYNEYIDLEVIPSGFAYSDNSSFWDYGYNALFYHEWHFNPYYHTSNDVIANMDLTYEMRGCKLVLATLAELAEPAPLLDVKANGSDDPITISSSETLSITVAMNTNGVTGNADWWLLGMSPFGLYHYDIQEDWLPGMSVSHQGPLLDLSTNEVLNIAHLPQGRYTFFFGIDLLMNGIPDMDQGYYDRVRVTVVP